jgi:hypothetical protein
MAIESVGGPIISHGGHITAAGLRLPGFVQLASDGTETGPSYAPTVTASTATIANGASLSDAVAVAAGKTVRGVIIPSAWTAAQLSFDVSHDDGVTYTSLRDPAGNEHVNAVSVSTFIPFPTVVGVTHIKIRSGILGTVVAQGAQRLLTVLVG